MIYPQKQDNLDVKLESPGILDAVVIRAEITESVSDLFKIDVFLHTSKDIDTEKIIKNIAVLSISLDNKNARYFSGIIENASFENMPNTISTKTENILYISIVPTVSILKYNIKYRSFQNLSAKEIIQNVLKENSISNVKINLNSAGSEKRIFCVQYQETDFDFISRLMEEEGIFYYFEHSSSFDTFCISDSSLSSKKIDNNLNVRKSSTNADITTDSVYNVSFSSSIGIKKIDSLSYNETKADVIKGNAEDSSSPIKIGNIEFYDRPFLEISNGDSLSKSILESDNSTIKKLSGYSYCPNIYPGCSFSINGSLSGSHNGDFFNISIKHTINQFPEEKNTPIYYNSFISIPNNTVFRPIQRHFKVRIFGCQTATVTGPSGEEIYCDENSRIKVKFHWDSRNKLDENSSCWIRVSQNWAGTNFGGLVIPRIGMEVLIDFINGDPDQPICTGCLYNGINKPPSNYPKENNTISTFYTNSSKGEGFNELRFNDKAEEEEIFIHAQKDIVKIIENSSFETLNEGSKSVILESMKDPVQNSLTIKKGDNKITLNEGDYTVVLDKGNQSITLTSGNQNITLSNGDLTIDVTGGINIKATKDIIIDSQSEVIIKSLNNTTIDSKNSVNIKAVNDFSSNSTNAKVTAKASINIDGLSAKITAKTNLDLLGLAVKITANATLNVKANAAASISSSAMIDMSGAAGISLKGAIIKLN